MANGGGSLLLGTEGNFIGPGHVGLIAENGVEHMSYHYYDGNDAGRSKLNIRKLAWTPTDWPVLADTLPPGDFNHDGLVNQSDLLPWLEHFGVDAGADADGDGDTDGADFLAWQQHLGANSFAAGVPSDIPEPISQALAWLAILGVTVLKRN
jgi:arabinan endo-1,5-alpha-L-arabinosidase